MEENIEIVPKVNELWEISEIANDFTEPLEIFREAISNAYDAKATEIEIEVYIDEKNEYDNFTIKITDNGKGMTLEQLQNFWSLGFSEKRDNPDLIGAKGHGTAIYLKSDYISVKTTSEEGSYESYCVKPLNALRNGKKYTPITNKIKKYPKNGTEIILQGYVKDESDYKYFRQNVIKDYIIWHTKHGSIEKQLGKTEYEGNIVMLKAFEEEKEKIEFGHVFPEINDNVEELKKKYEGSACDYFVKSFIQKERPIKKYPNYKYETVIYVEGTAAKKEYNKMISDNRKADKLPEEAYKIADRYGLYLCKDYIPIQKVNHWIKSFGTGSNSFGLLHGFINCQKFDLTANRGTVSIKNKDVMRALEEEIQEHLQEIQNSICTRGKDLDILNSYKEETKTKAQEEYDFKIRTERIKDKKEMWLENGLMVYEPKNEAETYHIYSVLNTLYPKEFDFEALDYCTNSGIDMLVRPKVKDTRSPEYKYVELKYMLSPKGFNHAFANISYVLCWDIEKSVVEGTQFTSKLDSDEWKYTAKGNKIFLDNDNCGYKIEIIKLKDIIKKHLKE